MMALYSASWGEKILDSLVDAMAQLQKDVKEGKECGARYGHLTKALHALERAYDQTQKAMHLIRRGKLP